MTTLRFDIEFHQPFLVGSGSSGRGLDSVSRPDQLLPNESLKGAMRAAALYVLGLEEKLVEQIFGSEGEVRSKVGASPWAWSDVDDGDGGFIRSSRSRNRVDDVTGSTVPSALAAMEVVYQVGDQVNFQVEQVLPLDDDIRREHEMILRACAYGVTALGQGRNRSMGTVTIRPSEAITNPEEFAVELKKIKAANPQPVEAKAATSGIAPATGDKRFLLIRMKPSKSMRVGSGAGSGFASPTLTYAPSSTLKGALGTAWLTENSGKTVGDLLPLLDAIRVSDAVPVSQGGDWQPAVRPLDRAVCKYPVDGCEGDLPASVEKCPTCGGKPERSKGKRGLPKKATFHPVTRVALDQRERAKDDHLFQREVLSLKECELVAVMATTLDDETVFLSEGEVVRIGGTRSVAGRAEIVSVSPYLPAPIDVPAGSYRLRIELMGPGVYVDELGFPSSQPSQDDLRHALGLRDASFAMEHAFTRWGQVTGWNLAVNVPRTEDVSVVAHSVFHVKIETDQAVAVPAIVNNLGLRSDEGCGWARIERIEGNNA